MIDRRQMIAGVSAASLIPTSAFADTPPNPAAAKLNVLMDDFMQRNLRRSPETATQLGLDKGALAAEKSQLDDRSLAAGRRATRRRPPAGETRAGERRSPARSRAWTRSTTTPSPTLQDIQAECDTAVRLRRIGRARPMWSASSAAPTWKSRTSWTPSIRSTPRTDAEAYLARMSAFAVAMDQESERMRHDAGLGVIPPDFVIDTTLGQMKDFADTPGGHGDPGHLSRHAAPRPRASPATGPAGRPRSIRREVLPALQRQMAEFAERPGQGQP